MRIKDLATRATKLLTGSAYMVFDNGTKVEKVDYAELAKQIITEYNTQTLAGSAQSVKAALDALNSKIGDVRFYFYRGTNTEIELPETTNIGIIFIQSGNSGNIYTRYATTLVKYTANENNNVTFTMSGDNTISRTGGGIVRILYMYIP